MLNSFAIRAGEFEKTVYSGAAGVTVNDVSLSSQSSLVIDYAPLSISDNALILAYDVDFAVEGLVGNRQDFSEYINRVQNAGSFEALNDTISGLVGIADISEYSLALTELGAEFYAEQQANLLQSTQQFTRSMQNCGSANNTRSSQGAACVWARYDINASSRDEDQGFPAVTHKGLGFTGGVQYALKNGWAVGVGVGIDAYESDGFGNRWRSESSVKQFGALAKYRFGETTAGALFTIGGGDYETVRNISVFQNATAVSERDLFFFSGLADISHNFSVENFSIRPKIDLAVTRLTSHAFEESGAGGQNLQIVKSHDTHIWVTPGVEIDFEGKLTNGMKVRPFANIAVRQFITSPSTTVLAGFRNAPVGVAPFSASSSLGRSSIIAEGGLELTSYNGISLSVAYRNETSSGRQSQTGSARITVPFR